MTLVVCLPGKSYSGLFVQCWTYSLGELLRKGHQVILMQRYSPNIYYARNSCLGGAVLRGTKQKPWDGKIAYDAMLWIDSDILFTPADVLRLLTSGFSIISGMYLMEGGTQFATVRTRDEEYFKKHGNFQFLTPKDLAGETTPFTVDYTGFGFIRILNGVFEALDYPWFRPLWKQIGDCSDFSMEDVAFCHLIKEKGYNLRVDPGVQVTHEKVAHLKFEKST